MIVSEDPTATLAGLQSALTQWMELQAGAQTLLGSHASERLHVPAGGSAGGMWTWRCTIACEHGNSGARDAQLNRIGCSTPWHYCSPQANCRERSGGQRRTYGGGPSPGRMAPHAVPVRGLRTGITGAHSLTKRDSSIGLRRS